MDLNTKNCCFFCLQPNIIKENDNNLPLKLLEMLCSHLQINFKKIPTITKVTLCLSCFKIVSKVLNLFLLLEKTEIELDWYLNRIYWSVLESDESKDVFNSDSNIMTEDQEDPGTLSFAQVIDKMRKTISAKCLKKQVLSKHLKLEVTKIKPTPEPLKLSVIAKVDDSLTSNESGPDLVLATESPPKLDMGSVKVEQFFCELEENDTDWMEPCENNDLTSEAATNSHSSNDSTKIHAFNSSFKVKNELPEIITAFSQETGMYKCGECSSQFKTKYSARHHFQKVHLKIQFKCQICTKKFRSLFGLEKHKTLNICRNIPNQLEQVSKTNNKHFCTTCGKVFARRNKLQLHIRRTHLNQNPINCTLCELKFKYNSAMIRHRDKIHFKKDFTCKRCGVETSDRWNLKTHLKTCAFKINL